MATSSHEIENTSRSAFDVFSITSPVLMLPAYAALFVATGMAGYVLAYHLDVTAFSIAFGMALVLAIGATFVANHGDENLRFGAQLVRFVTVPVLLVIAILGNSELFFTRNWLADANSVVAGYIGLIMVGCITLVGLPVEGKKTPVSMPLVSTLSLFGLLNLVLVDTIVQVGFLVFAAAGMFLIGYERVLSNWQTRRLNSLRDGSLSDESRSEAHMRRTARQFIGASAVWFVIFVVGALIAYTPLYALLPGIMPTSALGRLSQATQKPFDWTSAPEQLEVRGGNHTLTERPVLKIKNLTGDSPGLWRGRVYRNYIASSWKDDTNFANNGRNNYALANVSGRNMTPLPQKPVEIASPNSNSDIFPAAPNLQDSLSQLNKSLNSRYGIARLTTADIEPVDVNTRVVYSAGLPVALQAQWSQVRLNNNTGTVIANYPLSFYPSMNYSVTGRSVETNSAAGQARGLTGSELQQWKSNSTLASYLRLSDDSKTNEELQNIAQKILAQARAHGKKVDTPLSKVAAVGAYLHDTCLYSLDSPLTPSDQDGVLYFLKNTQSGACDMFASSMTLLLRSMDVPARLVTGYLEPEAEEGKPSEGLLIRERDAHAWVEYYVPELGWLTFDPSAGTRLADDSWSSRFKTMLGGFVAAKSGLLVVFPVLGLLLLGAGLFWPQIEKSLGRAPLTGDVKEQQRARVERAYSQAARMVTRYAKRHTKTPVPQRSLTARELDDWLSRTELPAAARQEFAALTYLRSAARYGVLPPEANDADLKDSLERLKQELK